MCVCVHVCVCVCVCMCVCVCVCMCVCGRIDPHVPVSSHPAGVQVARMDPLTMLQVAIKNNVGVFYFSSLVPVNVLLIEDGRMGES